MNQDFEGKPKIRLLEARLLFTRVTIHAHYSLGLGFGLDKLGLGLNSSNLAL